MLKTSDLKLAIMAVVLVGVGFLVLVGMVTTVSEVKAEIKPTTTTVPHVVCMLDGYVVRTAAVEAERLGCRIVGIGG